MPSPPAITSLAPKVTEFPLQVVLNPDVKSCDQPCDEPSNTQISHGLLPEKTVVKVAFCIGEDQML